MCFQHFFFQLNLVRGFPLEFFNPVFPMQVFLQSRKPHAGILLPLSPASLTDKNPQGSKIIHMLPRRTQRSID